MLNPTKYYEEFLRYYEMASWQHENCNIGITPYSETPFDDDLIKNVYLYDVVERKYAGFTQLLHDVWHGSNPCHPYFNKMSKERAELCATYDKDWGLREHLFIFFVHRLTGSGINYAKNPSGYHNSIIKHFGQCETIRDMVEVIKAFNGPMFTSVGYQIAPFPKPLEPYTRGGIYFICEHLPNLVNDLMYILDGGGKPSFREVMSFLEGWNQSKGFRVFRFQYAATLADIADFYPSLIDSSSPFFYGKNAIECLGYMFDKKSSSVAYLDEVMHRICTDTNSLPYNAEDVACDAIRWIENYINPKADYSHLDLDSVWSSHNIKDHPFGRQQKMLDLGLLTSFNGMKYHPSDDAVIKANGISPEEYRKMVNEQV